MKTINDLLKQMMRTKFSSSQGQIFTAILFKTTKHDVNFKRITHSEVAEMTGIPRPHVTRSIVGLFDRCIIIKSGEKIGINHNFASWILTTKNNGNNLLKGKCTEKDTSNVPRKDKDVPRKILSKKTANKKQTALSKNQVENEEFKAEFRKLFADHEIQPTVLHWKTISGDFKDYWVQIGNTAKGKKLDWLATFRNHVRRDLTNNGWKYKKEADLKNNPAQTFARPSPYHNETEKESMDNFLKLIGTDKQEIEEINPIEDKNKNGLSWGDFYD